MASRNRRMAAKHRKAKDIEASPQRMACGKISYPARKRAKEAARRLAGYPHRPGDESRPHVNAYKCFLCDAWHVGHSKYPCRYTVATIKGVVG